MTLKSSLLVFFTIPFLSSNLLGQDFWSQLLYNPTKTYSTGEAVVLSEGDSEIYTAKQSVTGVSPPNSTYWNTAAEKTTELSESPAFQAAEKELNDILNDPLLDVSKLALAVGGLTTPSTTINNNGDLNGDGIPDIIWQKSGTNETKFWFMNTDGTKKSELDLNHGAGTKWRLSSTGDMDNDGNIDLLWQEENGATVFCYYMDGSGGIREGASLASGVASGWRFVSASGDFNGDGNADLLWHSTNRGSTVCWNFNGQGRVSSFSPLGSKISDVFNSYAGHDMNSDGDSDVIYQNANNGKVVVWYFNDSKTVIGTKTYFEKNILDASLRVVGAKDYDNDGGVDILLQNQTTGVAKIVYFDKDGAQLSEKEIGTVGSTWEIRN